MSKIKNKFNIYFIAQLEAIASKLTESDIFFENKIRKWYCSNFNISFQDTFDLSWSFILQQYYLHQVDNSDHNDMFDLAVKEYLPEFVDQYEQENRKFAESLEEEAKETLRKTEAKDKEKKEEKKELPKIKEYDMKFNEEYFIDD